ncbi:hypothetical protein L598_006000000050 [Mesorhizobium sp. J18]|uniref:hypothetical protein n=1 Tax=Mesorhizobium sp. J18 TaxID=935263 RepID=UPI00119B5E68|nr:hypothetical protein [Mesorhizobium sp. J18]TWG91109.1 hypothetical protein L598_006000000050 [Mesorhizobium sp. J18]
MAQIGEGGMEISFVPVSIVTTIMLACELPATVKNHIGFGLSVLLFKEVAAKLAVEKEDNNIVVSVQA